MFDQNTVRIVNVDPKTASEWLAKSRGNRPIRNEAIWRYAEDMSAGRWFVGHDAITFDKNETLINGHHRLKAVILSGKTISFLVRYGATEEEVSSFDQGLGRTAVDAAHYCEGFEFLDPKNAAIVRLACSPDVHRKLSNNILLAASKDYEEELRFVREDCFENSKKINVIVGSVFVRAAQDKNNWDKLRYAGKYLLDNGDSVERQEIARLPGSSYLKLMNDYLLSAKKGKFLGSENRRNLLRICEICLDRFLKGDDNKPTLRGKTKLNNLFPSPQKSYLAQSMPSRGMSVSMLIALRRVIDRYSDGQILSPAQIAQDIVESTDEFKTKSPAKTVAANFAKIVKKHNNKLQINGSGYFAPVIDGPNQKRIDYYVFHKDNVVSNK